jgi:hypothetical protein
MFMSARNAKMLYIQSQRYAIVRWPWKWRTENPTAIRGSPELVHLAKILGACPRRARPYRIRDEQKRNEFAALNALVMTPALMMLGRTVRVNMNNDRVQIIVNVTFNPSIRHGNDIRRLGSSTRGCTEYQIGPAGYEQELTLEQVGIVIRNDKACDKDTKDLRAPFIRNCISPTKTTKAYIENQNTEEYPAYSLGDVPAGVFGLRSSTLYRFGKWASSALRWDLLTLRRVPCLGMRMMLEQEHSKYRGSGPG